MSLDVDLPVEQLTDSMNSITFEQVAQTGVEMIATSAQQTAGIAAFLPAENHHHLGNPNGHQHDLCGPGDIGQIVFSCANADGSATAVASQTPMSLASIAGVGFQQPVTLQQSLADGYFVETTSRTALVDDNIHDEQFGCFGLQDMLVSDDFQ